MKRTLPQLIARLALAGLLALAGVPAALAGPEAQAGPYQVELTTEPAVIPVGRAKLILEVTDRSGKPVTGADVRAIAEMPGMPMGERKEIAVPQPGQPGVYVAPAQFPMAGGYVATVKISGPLGAGTAKIPLKPGQNTAAGAGFSFLGLLPWLIGLLAVAFVLYRMRRTGQRPNWRAVFNRQVLGGLLLLAVMLAGSIYAVNHFRRKGAMTPIEAQAMEMSTPAPPGTAPVELATVQRGTVESTVRYTGQAVPYLEQDLYPRVTGWITWMPFYAGDKVKQGQLLARLDTSQLEPQVAERRAAVTMAQQGAGVARSEHQQALTAVNEARAGVAGKRGALAGARADLRAARAERASAEADLAAVETQVTDAAAQLAAARADQAYWQGQIRRTGTLLKEGAVSGEEYQREKAQAETADAKVRQAQARVNQVQAQVRAAQSNVRKADAMIAAAETKVRQMAAEVEAAEAAVRSSQAAASAAQKRIGQAEAAVEQARAALGGATTARGYTEIRSQIDGVVTQRVISPGVLVNPGQAILKIAQIAPMRLQANVAAADLNRVRVGSAVTVRDQDTGKKPVAARLTSLTPAVDPVARTGIIETVVANRDRRFLPGEYVVMEISTGRREDTLSVPSGAIRWRTPPSGGVLSTEALPSVWVAEPVAGREGQFTVRQVDVRVGLSSGARTEILSGLQAGQQVVVAGYQYLKNGDTVTAAGTAVAAGGETPPGRPTPAGGMPAMPGMEEPAGRNEAAAPREDRSRRTPPVPTAQRYTCPMHPEIVRNAPGKCPKCGMDLVPQEKAR